MNFSILTTNSVWDQIYHNAQIKKYQIFNLQNVDSYGFSFFQLTKNEIEGFELFSCNSKLQAFFTVR